MSFCDNLAMGDQLSGDIAEMRLSAASLVHRLMYKVTTKSLGKIC